MKKKLFAITVLMILGRTMLIYGQESETRQLEDFNKIIISGNSKVYLTQAATQEVRVETKNKLNEVQTNVSDHTLHIDGKPSSIYINIPELEEVTISGYGEIHSKTFFKIETLHLEISGNGKIILPVEVNNLNIDITGFGKLRLSGTANSVQLSVSGNGTIDAEKLKSVNSDIDISGVAKVSIDVTENLNMNVSGVGSVYYVNEPKSITRNVSGIGKYGMLKKEENDTTTVQLGTKRIVIIGGEEKTVDADEEDNVDVNIDIDNNTHSKKPQKARSHWAGIDVGFNGYFSDKTSTDLPKGYDFLELSSGKSVSIGVNIWKFDIPLYQRYIILTTGIGLTLNNYRFRSDKTLISDTNMVVAGFDYNDNGEAIGYNKNKLAVSYVTAPVLLQFNTHSKLKKSFHFATGMLFSYKYNSHLKLVYDENGDKQKTKRRDEFNIEPFRYDATIRIGYRNYTLFGTYAMSTLFKDKRGPSLHPFTAGIQLAGW
ncbi:MAG: DUF2807 domain-containing protein [Bacteroidota bacterium]